MKKVHPFCLAHVFNWVAIRHRMVIIEIAQLLTVRGCLEGSDLELPLHSGRLTWNIIMEAWKIIFLSKWVLCRFDVNLPGCRSRSAHFS